MNKKGVANLFLIGGAIVVILIIGGIFIFSGSNSEGSLISSKMIDCGANKTCLEQNMKACTPAFGNFSSRQIFIQGSKTMGCSFAGVTGECLVCEVTYIHGIKETSCIIPDFIFQSVGGKYGILVGEDLDSRYCQEKESETTKKAVEDKYPLLLSPSDLEGFSYLYGKEPKVENLRGDGINYTVYTNDLLNYNVNYHILPEKDTDMWIEQRVNVYETEEDLTSRIGGYYLVGGTPLTYKTIGDESKVYKSEFNINLYFREGRILVKMEISMKNPEINAKVEEIISKAYARVKQ